MIEIGVYECMCQKKSRHLDIGCDTDPIRTRINGEKCCGRYWQTDAHVIGLSDARELVGILEAVIEEEEIREDRSR